MSMNHPEYRFVRITEENIPDLLPIYQDAFKKTVDVDFLRRKQNTAFAGASYVGYIAYSENNEPAAFYGVFPCLAAYNGKTFLVAQSGDTMTHSQHTGKGLFVALAKKTYALCQELGIQLVFGFPNQNSYPGFVRKLDWVHFDDIEAYTIRVKGLSWFRIKQLFKLPDTAHEKRGKKILSKLPKGEPFPSSCLAMDTPVVDHSAEFFSYKKSYGNNYLVKLAGINVWLKFNTDYLLIGDIEKTDDKKLQEVLALLKKLAFRMFIPYIRFQGSSAARLSIFFKTNGQKMDVKYAIGGVNFTNEVPLEKMQFTVADNDTF